jgi:dipeptidyl aminopeptidase/acylaminoacyl peptidase
MLRFRILLLLGLSACLLAVAVHAAEEENAPTPEPVAVKAVLATEAVDLVLPAFHDQEMAGIKLDDLFGEMPDLPGNSWPAAGDQIPGLLGATLGWSELKDDGGHFALGESGGPAGRYLAFYLYSDRYQKATLSVKSDQKVKAFLDGQALSLAAGSGEKEEGKPAAQTAELTLPNGKHLVVLRSLWDPAEADKDEEGEETTAPAEPATWACGLSVTPADAEASAGLMLCTSPQRPVDIQLILDAPRIGGTEISPDGKLTAISLSEYRDGKNRESWVEIRDTKDGKLQHIWRTGQDPRGLQWSPDGELLCWQTVTDEKSSIWFFDPAAGQCGVLLADVEKLGGWQWTPDSKSLIYAVNREPEKDGRKVKRVLHPADRQSWWRNRSHLMQVFVPDGMTRRLTAGPVSPTGWAVSPDSRQMLFFTSVPDLTQRPYYTSELWLLDLQTLAVKSVLTDPWVGGAEWSPDNADLILLQGSPSAFDGLGRNLPEGMQANDYGGQLYLYNLKTGAPTAISMDLRPDVGWTGWSHADGMIYARCTDTQYNNIYRYDLKKKSWTRVDTGFESTSSLQLPRQGSLAVAHGTSVSTPNRVHTVDLKKNRTQLLLDPGAEHYADRIMGKVESWPVVLDKGMELDGFVYYPPMFDPAKKYPVIVYYYGGTSPITRDFGGRYPKNIWAGQGYIVYVPNPSGATGYGQEFAARHVNDWGKLTAAEVIEGTRKFLAAHPYADPEAVGCIGASYGGFLTEYILTQTDIFAAGVSHAGISSISSYWGEGLWGYAYGARALANAFPWADRDLYIEQSALFHADKITTPLLLVHGDSDTNVPVGESDQLFTALKLLGREVEYVQIQGQDHWVLDHDQRIVWNDTILAFFARHLKQRSAWWEALYPEPDDYR